MCSARPRFHTGKATCVPASQVMGVLDAMPSTNLKPENEGKRAGHVKSQGDSPAALQRTWRLPARLPAALPARWGQNTCTTRHPAGLPDCA